MSADGEYGGCGGPRCGTQVCCCWGMVGLITYEQSDLVKIGEKSKIWIVRTWAATLLIVQRAKFWLVCLLTSSLISRKGLTQVKVRSSTIVLSARTPTSLPLMRPFVLTLLLLPADQNYAVPGHIYNILQFSTIFVYGFQTEREAMKLLLLFAVVNVISYSKSQYCEGQCQGIFPLVNYHVDK